MIDKALIETIARAHQHHKAIKQFVEENEEVFAQFRDLCEIYNHERKHALELMREVQPGFSHRGFTTTNPKPRITFNPKALPTHVLSKHGVVKAVDNDRIANLILAGEILEEDVAAARQVEVATPACSAGPLREINIKLE